MKKAQRVIDEMDDLIQKADDNADFENPLNCYLKSIAIGTKYLVDKVSRR